MRQFNIKRFWNTFRWYFCENRGRLLTYTGVTTILAVVLESTFSFMGNKGMMPTPAYIIMTKSGFAMSMLCAIIGCYLSFCGIFSTLKTKQKRIAYLTLPATNLERYLTAFLMAVIIIPICIFIGLAIGDTIHMLIFAILGNEWFSCIKSLFDSIMEDLTKTESLREWISRCVGLWACSFYVLGGTWFRRRSFLIVTTSLILLFIVGIYVLKTIFGENGQFKIDLDSFMQNADNFRIAAIFVLTALSLFNFWLSYKIFNRFQIITSKWTNV